MDSARYYALLAIESATKDNNTEDKARAMLLLCQSSALVLPREALGLYLSTRILAISCNEKAVQFRADLTIGAIYRRETKYDSTKFYYNEAIKIANALILQNRSPENLRRLGMVYNNYGAYYSDVQQMSKAVYYLVETEKIGRELKDTAMMFRAAINVGGIYNELGSPENKASSGYTQKMFLQKAIVYFKIAYSLLTPEDEKYIPTVMNNIGLSYLNMGKHDSAAYYLKNALALHLKSGDKGRICSCHYNLGSAYYKQNRMDLSAIEFDAAIAIAETNDIKSCLISALSNKGQLLTHQNKLNEAEAVLKRALELKISISDSRENYLLYEKFYQLYEKKKDFKKAFDYYQLFINAKDSVADVEHLNLLDEIEVKYETEKKDEQISELSLEKQLLLEKNRTREAQLKLREFWIIGLILFLIMAGAIVWIWIQRNKLKHQQEAVDLEHRLLRARMNPHFLFNGLNTIQKHYTEGNLNEANQYMVDFSKFLRMILNKTGETMHTLEDELEFTNLYVSLEQRKYPDKIKFTSVVQEGLEVEQWMVPSLLFQPIVENAIWHGILPSGRNGEIDMKVFENQSHDLICEITDNGVGFDQSILNKKEGHISKAFELIAKRLGKKGTIQVKTLTQETDNQTGTKITLTIHDSN